MLIRKATSAELRLLPALESAADSVFEQSGLPPMPPPGSMADLTASALVLVAGTPPVGFARVEIIDHNAHLEQLSVHPDYSRRGIGSNLVHAVLRWAETHSHPQVTLCTFADVPWNGPFYRRLGFTEPTELTPGLRRLLDRERELGLDLLERRVVLARRPSCATSQ